MLFAEPIDQGNGPIGPGGMDQPTGRFIDHEEPGIGSDDGGMGNHSDTQFVRLCIDAQSSNVEFGRATSPLVASLDMDG